MLYDALYGRQSIEKKDSISVESQLEYCRYETRGKAYIEYADRGFSGKDTNRPAFERMMEDVRKGKIRRVIVYKLDRISRSIVDFANMMEEFQKYGVEFVSSTEKFDTSTPIGRAMLNICIVFAQLERETIQKRVTDSYWSRSKKGLYMGGRVPYGYRLKEAEIENVKTSMYEEIPEESRQLKEIYSLYANPENSLGDVIRYLNQKGIKQLRGGKWTSSRLSDMLRNPVYVRADIDVYNFFKSQGAVIYSPVSAFNGRNACYLYKGGVSETRKQSDLKDKEVVISPHEGIIESDIWLRCRTRCLENRQSARGGKSKNSYLTGKVKCGVCGYALVIRKANTRQGRYFICSQSISGGICRGPGRTVYAGELEEYVLKAMRDKVISLSRSGKANSAAARINTCRENLTAIEEEIKSLLSRMTGANTVLMKYINDRVLELDSVHRSIQEEILSLKYSKAEEGIKELESKLSRWEELRLEDKKTIVDSLIKVIHVHKGKTEIIWKI